LGPCESTSKTASRLVQPFLHSSLQSVPTLQWVATTSKLPLPLQESGTPSAHPSRQPKRHLDWLSHFTTVTERQDDSPINHYNRGHIYVPSTRCGLIISGQSNLIKTLHHCHRWTVEWYSPGGASVHPPNTFFLGPIRVYNPNGISIGSAIFCGVAEHGQLNRIRQVVPVCNPRNICFLSPPETTTHTASQSVQRFLHSSRQSVIGHARTCVFP